MFRAESPPPKEPAIYCRIFAIFAIVLLAVCGPARALDITEALDRGQQVQLDRCPSVEEAAAPDPRAAVIRASFERALGASSLKQPVSLRIAKCNAMVQVLGGVVVAHPALASWNEGERLFVLAHELGHIANGDWLTFKRFFAHAVPQELDEQAVNAAMRSAQPYASSLMHSFEYGADAYAVRLLTNLGREAVADGTLALRQEPPTKTSVTHPGTFQRITRLASAN